MTIQDLGSLGELIAAIATLVTLAYLALQIRQSTTVSRASTVQSTVQFSANWIESLYRDPELALLFERGMEDSHSLDDAERSRFFFVMIALARVAENVHYQFEQGMMSEDLWGGYRESTLRMLEQPGSRQWWKETAPRFSSSFRAFLDRELERRAVQHGDEDGR